jgi:predicted N-acetyltransferase YhbS
VRVREAQPGDDVAVGELLVEAFVAQYAKKLPEVVYTEARKRELRAVAEKRQVATVLVAELDGRVVGTVALFPPGAPGSRAFRPHAADLRHLATDVALHGQGLGAPLLAAAEAQARAWGARAICLHVRRGVEGVARLYLRHGWVRAPEADLVLPEVSLDAFVKAL